LFGSKRGRKKLLNTEFTEKRGTEDTEKDNAQKKPRRSKNLAEVQKKYFGRVKFSTQVLKTLCKRGLAAELTRHSSTA